VPTFEDPVAHLGAEGFPAIEAWRLDQDRLSREEPADRWRLKRSLGEPLLLVVDRDAVLIGKNTEGRKARDQVGVGEEKVW
jgi:hypothetical protein